MQSRATFVESQQGGGGDKKRKGNGTKRKQQTQLKTTHRREERTRNASPFASPFSFAHRVMRSIPSRCDLGLMLLSPNVFIVPQNLLAALF